MSKKVEIKISLTLENLQKILAGANDVHVVAESEDMDQFEVISVIDFISRGIPYPDRVEARIDHQNNLPRSASGK